MIGSWAMPDNKGILSEIAKKVSEIYENYGIDPRSMEEADLIRIYDYYLQKPKELKEDLMRSREHSGKFDDDIL